MSVSKAVEAIIQSSYVFLSSLSFLRGEGGRSLIEFHHFRLKHVHRPSGRVRVTYADPKGEVVTPGQICVAYLEDGECLGGGEICERGWVWEKGVRLPPRALE